MSAPVAPRPVELKPSWLGDLEPLPWEWAHERVEQERNYWLVTVRRDGFPQARPVWGLWDGALLFLSIGGGGLSRTARKAGEGVTVHVDSAENVVIIEGRLLRVRGGEPDEERIELAPDRLAKLIEAWNIKYDHDWSMDRYGFNFAVRPDTVLAWRESEERDNADASGKWRF